MLKNLYINNFAIIKEIDLHFSEGLNVFTGETGAGKSIVIEALSFALGARADFGLIGNYAGKMLVKAVFSSAALPEDLKKKYNITTQDFIITREIDKKGKAKITINSKNASASELAHLGDFLVDFHGQHEHQTLFKTATHIDMLDKFCGLEKELKKVKEVYEKVQAIKAKIAASNQSEEEKQKALAFYSYQLEEIEKVNPVLNEDSEIENALPKLKHTGKLLELAQNIYNLLSDNEENATSLLDKASLHLGQMAQIDESLEKTAEELENAATIVQDCANTIFTYKDSLEIDPKTLDEMLSRQEDLRKLKMKYGPALEDVLAFKEKLEKSIRDIKNASKNTEELFKDLQKEQKELDILCQDLHKKRAAGAKKLKALVVKEIEPLGFSGVRFETDIQEEQQANIKGKDKIEFLFSANIGEALKPLRNIASGGEISRLMLGLKTILAGQTPTMVFDEIDTGIGGQTGKLIGQKLKKAAKERQVFCITHLAQAAVFAQSHFAISKEVASGKTQVKVITLSGEQKVQEIARMIGSSKGAMAGLMHARELLQEAKNTI
ncbi:MAG: DNA repair protein RecN [Elusimicrobiaceae bacterium]|nr:DNA repair protein RecN [Elusimicrobiaceae bacterium]